MSETSNALRATSDSLMQDLAALHELEIEKRRLPPADPRLQRLAEEIEAIAIRVMGSSMRQRRIGEQAAVLMQRGAPDAPTRSIAETPREIHVILAEWRDAERALADAMPGTMHADRAEDAIDRLRAEYRRAHQAAQQRRTDGVGG